MANRICRGDGVDQISTLPDDVLVRILSLIPTEQAVTTSFLSKRWKSLWTLLPNLDFDFDRFSRKFNALSLGDQQKRFLDFVEHVIFLHGIEALQNLRLAFDMTEFDEYISKASLLVKSAMRSECLIIDLDFSQIDPDFIRGYDELYTLPPCFFPHPSVTQLKLTGCKVVPSFYKSFTSVNIVKFTTVQLQKDSVYDLVSKCPCLQELHLVYCQVLSSVFELIAPESNLKYLVLQSCLGNEGEHFEHASIHIPTLLLLKYTWVFKSGYLSIGKSENLTKAEINIYSPSNEHKLLCKLLKELQNVKSLILFSRQLEVLNTNGGISLLTPLNNLKQLTVNLTHLDEELLGLMCLLRSSPRLETISVDFRYCTYETKDELISSVYEEVQQPHLLPSVCVPNLVKIKIENFQGLKAEMEFVKRVLLGSLCLKEMVICIHSRYRDLKGGMGKEHSKTLKKKKAEAIERLLACTRASPDAKIILK